MGSGSIIKKTLIPLSPFSRNHYALVHLLLTRNTKLTAQSITQTNELSPLPPPIQVIQRQSAQVIAARAILFSNRLTVVLFNEGSI